MSATEVSTDELADLIAAAGADALLAFDVDGVLAPLVEHADDSRLQPGVGDALERLSQRQPVTIISGRSLDDLERLFGFASTIEVIGSHGLERRSSGPIALDDDEQYTFDQLELLGQKAVEAAGEGAWLEYKPASVAVHVRTADPVLARPAVDAVARLASMIDGAEVKHGHMVVELLARSTTKGEALAALRADGQAVVFLGDDVTDESAFELMTGERDVSVRVGPGDTAARYRIGSPNDVATLLQRL